MKSLRDIVFYGPSVDGGSTQAHEQISQSNLLIPIFVNCGFLPGIVGNNLVKQFRFTKLEKLESLVVNIIR